MKKTALVLSVVAMIASCVPGTNSRVGFENDQQYAFDSIHNDLALTIEKASNDIKKNEAYDAYKESVANFMDSALVFHNWKGRISNIKSQEAGNNSTDLSFEIEFTSPKYNKTFGTGKREYKFEVDYIVNNDSLSSDSVYQRISNMSNYKDVYFAGIIRSKTDGTPYISRHVSDYDSFDKEYQVGHPQYYFFVVDISPKPLAEFTSALAEAVKCSHDVIEPLKLNFRGKISNKEKDKMLKDMQPKYDDALKNLTPSEKAYILQLNTAYTYDYLYAQ